MDLGLWQAKTELPEGAVAHLSRLSVEDILERYLLPAAYALANAMKDQATKVHAR